MVRVRTEQHGVPDLGRQHALPRHEGRAYDDDDVSSERPLREESAQVVRGASGTRGEMVQVHSGESSAFPPRGRKARHGTFRGRVLLRARTLSRARRSDRHTRRELGWNEHRRVDAAERIRRMRRIHKGHGGVSGQGRLEGRDRQEGADWRSSPAAYGSLQRNGRCIRTDGDAWLHLVSGMPQQRRVKSLLRKAAFALQRLEPRLC